MDRAKTYFRNVLKRLKREYGEWLEIDSKMVYFEANERCRIDVIEFQKTVKEHQGIWSGTIGSEDQNSP